MSNEDGFEDVKWTDQELKEMDTGTSADELSYKRAPIQIYINRKEQYGKERGYIDNIERVLREYEAFLADQFRKHPLSVNDSHVSAFNDFLKSDGFFYTIRERGEGNSHMKPEPKQINLTDRSRQDYLNVLVSFYVWLSEDEGIVSINPAKKALNDFPENEFDLTPPNRRKIEMHHMREFLRWLPDSTAFAIILFLLKTGSRIGEAMNVDMSHLHLDHPYYDHLLDVHDIELVHEVANKPDSVYFRSGFQKGTEVDGEIRSWGNKRKRETGSVVPIDDELNPALIEYLSYRGAPNGRSSQPMPLFEKPTTQGNGDRLTKGSVRALLMEAKDSVGYLKEYGWYEEGAPTEENVTPHYFRHYFTHNHKHNRGVTDAYLPKGVRKYIRGDVPNKKDVEDNNYTHADWDSWEKYIEKEYLRGIYKFDLY